MRLLDLFCGRWGWSKAFAARGWECVGVDLVEPPEIPHGCEFVRADVMQIEASRDGLFSIREHEDHGPILWEYKPDFVCVSSPCEEFSVFEMMMFHKFPPYPDMGIKLFNHARKLCYLAQVAYIMENVRGAQTFVGEASHNCGPFYLWGNAVPVLVSQGIKKGIDIGSSKAVKGMTKEEKRIYRAQFPWIQAWSSSKQRQRDTAKAATIPPELAHCVAEYAERLIEQRKELVSQ